MADAKTASHSKRSLAMATNKKEKENANTSENEKKRANVRKRESEGETPAHSPGEHCANIVTLIVTRDGKRFGMSVGIPNVYRI